MKRIFYMFCFCLLAGCAAGRQGKKIDFSEYDTNNVMTPFEHENAKANIFITTQPPGADVFMDKKYVGKANENVINLLPGKRVIMLIKDDYYFQTTLYLQPGSNLPVEITLKKK